MLLYKTINRGVVRLKLLEIIKSKFYKVVNSYNNFFNKRYEKYIVDYKIEDDKIKIVSSTGDYRIVKNNKSNITKLNKSVVQNKVNIQRKIDEYENNYKERLVVLLINLLAIIGFGTLICLTFFIGNYYLFIMSIIFFSLGVITTTLTTFNYLVTVKEITNLKKLTGYESESEFSLEDFKLSK